MVQADENFRTGVFVFQCCILTFGALGNILSFLIWTFGKRCSKLPVSTYFRFLAVVDFFFLAIPGVELLLYLPPVKMVLRNQNIVLCKTLVLMTTSCLRISSWTLVVLSVEKALRIALPLRLQTIPCGMKWRTPVALFIVALVSVSMNVPHTVNSVIIGPDVSSGPGTNTTAQDGAGVNGISNGIDMHAQTNQTIHGLFLSDDDNSDVGDTTAVENRDRSTSATIITTEQRDPIRIINSTDAAGTKGNTQSSVEMINGVSTAMSETTYGSDNTDSTTNINIDTGDPITTDNVVNNASTIGNILVTPNSTNAWTVNPTIGNMPERLGTTPRDNLTDNTDITSTAEQELHNTSPWTVNPTVDNMPERSSGTPPRDNLTTTDITSTAEQELHNTSPSSMTDGNNTVQATGFTESFTERTSSNESEATTINSSSPVPGRQSDRPPRPVTTTHIATPTPNMTTPTPHLETPTPNMTTHTPHLITPIPNMATPTPDLVTPTPNMTTPSSHLVTPTPNMATPSPHLATTIPNIATPTQNLVTPILNMTTHTPHLATPTPNMATPTPHLTTHTLNMATPTPHLTTHTLNMATSTPHLATPVPNKATPTSYMVTPTPNMTTPTPNLATPTRNMATPTPYLATSTPNMATPFPHLVTPTPYMATPSPHLVTPTLNMTTPTPNLATPTPNKATPTPHLFTPTPNMTTPTPHLTTPTLNMTTPTPNLATPTPNKATPTPHLVTHTQNMTSTSQMITPTPSSSTTKERKCKEKCAKTGGKKKKHPFIGQYCNYIPSEFENMLDITLIFFVPFSVFVVCNSCILYQLFRRTGSHSNMGINAGQQNKRKLEFKHMTYHVFGLCIVHTVSTAPWCIFSINRMYNEGADVSDHYYAVYDLLNAFAYLNSAVNVVIYCAIGVDFRRDIRQVFTKGGNRNHTVVANSKACGKGFSGSSSSTSTTTSTRL